MVDFDGFPDLCAGDAFEIELLARQPGPVS
jgi:hypothetical protein